MQFKTSLRSALKLAICLIYSSVLVALPDVNQVVNGDVNIAQVSEKVLQVNQNAEQAIINWNSFNIDAHEKVHFQQPVNGVCLNRIDASNGMSQINGSISSTGKIFLINQAGILFGETAQINVGGIIASAADIADDNFNINKYIFDQTSPYSGAIINRGVIKVNDHGLAALLGSSVSNEGVIVAKYGNIMLKSGSKFVIDFYGDGVINFESVTAGIDEIGDSLPNGVNMSGQIISDSGDVIIMASAAPGIFDNLINMSGEIRAKNVVHTDNAVILVGDDQGIINVSGQIDASGIVIVGNQVVIGDDVTLDVSGDSRHGWIALADSSGKVKSFNADTDKSLYVGLHVTLNSENLIPAQITASAVRTFYDYKKHVTFTPPATSVSVSQSDASDKRIVNMDVNYNGFNLNMRSIQPEDYELVQTYLNSQPLVRNKYANRQTVDVAATQARVKVLADRFNESVTDGCFMLGGFIITDSDTNSFIGMVNSGTSGDKGITEMGYMSRPDAWSHKPENLAVAYKIPESEFLQKEYNGVATAVVSSLVQYTEQLAQEQYTVKGEPITALRATSMVENTGGWKALAKNGFDLKAIHINKDWGSDIRYQLEHHFK